MNRLSRRQRNQHILRSPYNQHRLRNIVQPKIQQITPTHHRRQTPLHYPGISLQLPHHRRSSKIRHNWRLRSQHRNQLPRPRLIVRSKKIRLPSRRKIHPRAVIHNQPIHRLRMVQRQLHHNPSTHRPPANIRPRNMHRPHEINDRLLLQRNRVIHIRPRRPPISQQIRHPHVEPLGRQPRYHRRPGLTPVSKPVHQHQRRPIRRPSLKVMQPIPTRFDVLALHPIAPEMKSQPSGLRPKSDSNKKSPQPQPPPEPEQPKRAVQPS